VAPGPELDAGPSVDGAALAGAWLSGAGLSGDVVAGGAAVGLGAGVSGAAVAGAAVSGGAAVGLGAGEPEAGPSVASGVPDGGTLEDGLTDGTALAGAIDSLGCGDGHGWLVTSTGSLVAMAVVAARSSTVPVAVAVLVTEPVTGPARV
jgi:hypothetical protein